MSDWLDRIIASSPINKTAAVVTGGGSPDDLLTPKQRRENLVSLVKQIDRAIANATDPARRKHLGLRKAEVCLALSVLPRVVPRNLDLSRFIADVAKERLPKIVFQSIVEEAARRHATSETIKDGAA